MNWWYHLYTSLHNIYVPYLTEATPTQYMLINSHISLPFIAANEAAARAIEVGRDPVKDEVEAGGVENRE